MHNLKERTIRGGAAKVATQAATFTLRMGSVVVLSRLLEPKDFGLVGMVTAIIGVLILLRDFGLSTATVQRLNVTEEQVSTLFWVNLLVGGILSTLAMAAAPVIAHFYREPRLFAVTAVLSTGFLFNAIGVQHSARLQRQMRFTTSAIIDIIALVVSVSTGIGMALKGYGYWALVGMTFVTPLVSTSGFWLATGWIPGLPRRNVGIRFMLRFGGTITLNGLIVYFAYNLEKILLGRYWGAEVVGLYVRAYQLINIPTDNLNTAAGEVAFAALSRVQDDALRLKNYFLKGYSLVLSLTLPITVVCSLFANDLILVVLGPKWKDAAAVFRLLAPTILIFALINPLSWLLFSLGMVGRSLKVALVLTPLVISGYLIGLPYGPKGVALAYSSVMALWVVPHIVWCVHGTVISLRDIARVFSRPFLSGLVGGVVAFVLQSFYGQLGTPLLRLIAGGMAFLSVYLGMLIYIMGQRAFYLDLLRGFKGQPPVAAGEAASI